jgi:uncharacterized protein YxjI
MLDRNKFVVNHKAAGFMSKDSFEIADADTGEVLAVATEKPRGFMGKLMAMMMGKESLPTTIEVRRKSDNGLEFAVRRKGFFAPKIQTIDGEEQVIGSYKAKVFTLSGGFTVYDKDGKQFADLQGKMFSSEYKFKDPKGTVEIGSVSRTWGGLAKSMFSGTGTYAVEFGPDFASDQPAKMLLLGAAIAIDTLFKKKEKKEGSTARRGSGGETE